MSDSTEADVLQTFAALLQSREEGGLDELFTLLRVAGDEGDWTDDSMMILSLASPELEQRVLETLAPTFAGDAGAVRRQAWDERRALLKREVESFKDRPTE